MSSTIKILLGAIATAIFAWLLHGALGYGAKCKPAAAVPAAEETAAAPVAATTPAEEPAKPEEVKNCQADVDAIIKGKTINFATSGSAIAADSIPLIDSLGKALAECEGVVVEVSGHTDPRGDDAANQKLSEARANSVVKALTERKVPAGRMKAVGYGETKLLDSSGTPAADAKNRRIDFGVAAAGAAASTAATPAPATEPAK